ncbi:PEP-CTERM sorting domain-containing protein [Aeoliella sp. ICT_H6.2]|uniref:PEP-CTERM sorting domain-containing protein n=1 Tax=Aeoliella straminimaris TaxID=2954799 RepID=A0A9X2FCA7_9BACT|nr:PEP-CTERM sorting domain-containing protein [Aeoliella straminimaris]MCO6043684.1 PEP-CTERM sorting domain-containing protein [Aeoliella straminimaris]
MFTIGTRRSVAGVFGPRVIRVVLLGIALFFGVGRAADAQLVGLWEFENASDPGGATIGNDLIVNNTNATIAGVAGIDGSDGAVAVGIGDYFSANHDIPPNGGSGSYVNEYTFVYDVYLPVSSDSSWRTLFQTSDDNSNDGDYFISTSNTIGVAAIGYSSQTISAGDWYRIVFSADIGASPSSFTTTVTDASGTSWSFDHGAQGLDGRHALYSTANENIVNFFADNDGDDAELHVSNLAIFDRPLSSFQVEALGVPGDPIAFTPNPVLAVEINRDSGAISISNPLSTAQGIKGYSIRSSAGALLESNFVPLADSDSSWVQLTASGATDNLSEAHLTTGSIPSETPVMLDNGSNGAWLKYFDESDISFEYLNENNELIKGDVLFTGTTQTVPYPAGDLNFDGAVDGLDWNTYVADLGTRFSELSDALAYRQGDFNSDGVNNHADFIAFKSMFDAANGAGSFQAMLAGSPVPEPSSLAILAMAGLALVSMRRRLGAAVVALCVVACTSIANAQLVGLWEFGNAANPGQATIGNNLVVNNTNGTIVSTAGVDGADGAFSVGVGDYFTANHDIAPNGGSSDYVNEYTFVYDVYLPASTDSTWRSLFQTNLGNTNDGDYFVSTSNRLGVAEIGYTTQTVSEGAWYRLVFAADIGTSESSFTTTVIDGGGTSWSFDHLEQGLDGRHSLYSTANENLVHFFADENGEDNEVHVSTLAIFDEPLKSFQVGFLGGPGDPISYVPEPTLTLNIDKRTGNVTIDNESGNDLGQPINFYEIISGDGQGGDGLLTTSGWNSLSDQSGITAGIDPVDHAGSPTPGAGNDPGETWDEGNSSVDILTEAFLSGSTAFADSFSVNLGSVYTGGISGAEDITFNYALEDGTLVSGNVEIFISQPTVGDFNGDGVVDIADYTVWRNNLGASESVLPAGSYTAGNGTVDAEEYSSWKSNFGTGMGAGALAGSTVPEPGAMLLVVGLVGVMGIGRQKPGWGADISRRVCCFLLTALFVSLSLPSWAAKTTDRSYLLGDDSVEAPVSNGLEVGTNFQGEGGSKFTADSAFVDATNFTDAQDLQAFGSPVYRDVVTTSRPGGSGYGIEFDGVDDRLQGIPLNIPEQSVTDTNNFPSGFPFIYAGLQARGLQMWVRPDQAGLNAGVRQTIVMDTTEAGGVAITADGKWTQIFDTETTDGSIPATVPVVGDTWYHVMQHIYPSEAPGAPVFVPGVGSDAGFTSVVYVDGIAVSASNDFPDPGDLTAGDRVGVLSIGAAELANQDSNPSTADFGEYFDGTIDDLEMYVFGDNSDLAGGQNYGTFDLFADNEWIADEIANTMPGGVLLMGDVNMNGVVSGNGTGPAATDDVTAFVDNWLFENRITGWGNKVITVGDWSTWEKGDMNHDGTTDLRDWALINAANPSMGSAIVSALSGSPVPEPSALVMIGISSLFAAAWARGRR